VRCPVAACSTTIGDDGRAFGRLKHGQDGVDGSVILGTRGEGPDDFGRVQEAAGDRGDDDVLRDTDAGLSSQIGAWS
jgi:hypothetical protein